jgi:hypothetical protein
VDVVENGALASNVPNLSLAIVGGLSVFIFGRNAAMGGADLGLIFDFAPLDLRGWRLGLHLRADGGGMILGSDDLGHQSDSYFYDVECGLELSPGTRWVRLDGGYFLLGGGFDPLPGETDAASYSTLFSGPYVGGRLAICTGNDTSGRCQGNVFLGFHGYIGKNGAGYMKASAIWEGRAWFLEGAGLFHASDNQGNTGGWGLVLNAGFRFARDFRR